MLLLTIRRSNSCSLYYFTPNHGVSSTLDNKTIVMGCVFPTLNQPPMLAGYYLTRWYGFI